MGTGSERVRFEVRDVTMFDAAAAFFHGIGLLNAKERSLVSVLENKKTDFP